LEKNNCQPRAPYPAKLFFKMEGEIKTFCHNHRQKQFTTTKPALKNKLRGLLHTKEEGSWLAQELREKNHNQRIFKQI
jgi:hypothetical protein